MVTVNIEMVGVDRLLIALEEGPALTMREAEQATQRATLIAEADIKRDTPRVTGRLFSSIGSVTEVGVAEVVGKVGTNVFYAPIVERGRGPVVATNAKALRFKVGGRVIYRKSVKAAEGRHMFERGFASAVPAIRAEFVAAGERILAALKGGTR